MERIENLKLVNDIKDDIVLEYWEKTLGAIAEHLDHVTKGHQNPILNALTTKNGLNNVLSLDDLQAFYNIPHLFSYYYETNDRGDYKFYYATYNFPNGLEFRPLDLLLLYDIDKFLQIIKHWEK